MPLSKPFAIATEGKTVDGRTISRDWITQMAASYDPKVYTAVANLEHYLSSLPDSVFGAYGKVVALSTREVDVMGDKKLQLMAVVDANDKLVSLQKAGQKCFASMEILHDFIGKGIAYLGGLAFTNTPASIGTEAMKFSFAAAPGERYAFADEIAIEFEAAATEPSAGESLFAKVKTLLGLGKKESDDRFADQAKAIEAIAQSQKDLLDKFASIEPVTGELIDGKVAPSAEEFAALKEAHDKVATEFAALKEKLGTTDGDGGTRPPATGGNGQVKTDC
jgi:hypothetical protein